MTKQPRWIRSTKADSSESNATNSAKGNVICLKGPLKADRCKRRYNYMSKQREVMLLGNEKSTRVCKEPAF